MNNIKQIRKEKNIKVEDIIKTLKISAQGYYKYERENTNPPIETLLKLADIFNVSLDYLLGRKNNIAETKTPNQIELLNYFNQLNEMEQQRVIGFVESMAKEKTNTNNSNFNRKYY